MLHSLKSGIATVYRWLCSTEGAVILLLAVCLLAIPGTTVTGVQQFSCSPLVTALLALIGASTLLCTARRFKALHFGVIIIHAGVIVTLAGAVASRFGFISTVNVFEGDSVNQAYRWDLKADAPLGFDLAVRKISREYYPAPVRIGVLRGEEKVGLFTLTTGESFDVGGFTVQVESLDPGARKAFLNVFQGGTPVGRVDTSLLQQLGPGFPYAFRLVSYKTPVMKRMWSELALTRDSGKLAEGVSEVNAPLNWGGLDLFLVQTATDPYGRSYAGIQIVRDPGRPAVFAGFVLVSFGAVMSFARRMRSTRTVPSIAVDATSSSPTVPS